MQQTSIEQPSLGPISLSEPHFDEEATVLSARPVVPLSAVPTPKTNVRNTRPWMLGLGLVGALLVGVVATAFYFARQDDSAPASTEAAEVTGGAQGGTLNADESIAGPLNAPPVVQTVKAQPAKVEVRNEAPTKNQTARTPAASPKKPEARLVTVIRESGNGQAVTTSSREERRAERREARREERRAERGRRDRRSADDVLRIQEIFEGKPRP